MILFAAPVHKRAADCVKEAALVALPWQSVKGYRLAKDGRVVAEFVRRDAAGRKLAEVTSVTDWLEGSTTYSYQIGSNARDFSVCKTLADALAEAEAALQVKGYEVIGRVVWG